MASTRSIVKRIRTAAEKLGWTVEEREAQTGTAYLYCSRGDDAITIRVSDHAECYEPSRGEKRISVDPFGYDPSRAIAALTDPSTVSAYRPDPVLVAEHQRALAEVAREEKLRASNATKNADAVRAMLTADDYEEWNRLGHSRKTARVIAQRLGAKPGRVYKAFTGRNF